MEYKTIIIGGGLMGSAAAWQLSKNGNNVLLLEQQGRRYHLGSSLGKARITRSLGPKGDIWAYMHEQSIVETQQLIDYLNTLSGAVHQMQDLYHTSPVSYFFYKNKAKIGGFESVLDYRLDFCKYAFSKEEALDLFNIKLPFQSSALIQEYKEYSGTLNPKELISKLHQAILAKGASIDYNQKVIALSKEKSQYKILIQHTLTKEEKVIYADKLICAAGAYTGPLLQKIAPIYQQIIRPQRVYLAFFKPLNYPLLSKTQQQQLLDAYPAIYFTNELSFAMIEAFDSDGIPIIKIGGHFCRSKINNLDTVWEQALSPDEIAWAFKNTLQHLRDANIPIEKKDLKFHHSYSCVYSLTKSEIPIISNYMDLDENIDPNCVVMAGMSGVGAKGAMGYGRMAANLLLQNTPSQEEQYIYTAKLLSQLEAW